MKANKQITNKDLISTGAKLNIPGQAKPAAPAPAKPAAAAPAPAKPAAAAPAPAKPAAAKAASTVVETKAKPVSASQQTETQFTKAVAAFGSIVSSFAKTVTAFATTVSAYSRSTKRFDETINRFMLLTGISNKAVGTNEKNNRRGALDDLVAGTISTAEDALSPIEQFQSGLTDSTNQLKYLREEELKRHRFTELSMSQFRKSVEDAAAKLDTISGIKRSDETDDSGGGGGAPSGGGSPAPTDGSSGTATKVTGGGAGYTTLQYADGKEEKRTGTLAWRNNNPGNIRSGSFAKSMGAVGESGGFAVFSSYEQGRKAKEELLFNTSKYKNKTIAGAINRYAPPNENDTRGYISTIAKAVGVSPNTPLRDLTPEQRTAMLNAMEKIEGFKAGQVQVLKEGKAGRADISKLGGSLKDIVGSVLNLGGGLTGNKRNLENVNSTLDARAAAAFKEYNKKTGKTITLTSGFRYPGDQAKISSGNNPKARPGKSRHERGLAIDINSADVSALNQMGLLDKYGLIGGTAANARGGRSNDPPHIELKAAKGGVFDGPDSGYPVELHGGEMITPLDMNSILMKLAKTPADISIGEQPEKMLQGAQYNNNDSADKIMQMHSDLIDVLSRKLDNMLDKLDDGNDTRQKILRNNQS
jgi:hypothetical protein